MPMAAKTVNTARHAHRALKPTPFKRFTNRVAAYMKEEEPYKGDTDVIHFLELLRDEIGFDGGLEDYRYARMCA